MISSKHFSANETKCKDGTQCPNTDTSRTHLAHMETLREWYNKPMRVNCWYRTPAHNKKVGGVSKSQHLYGNACDIALPSEFYTFAPTRKQEYIKNMCVKWHSINNGKGGFGIYDTFIHFDSRTSYVNFDYRKNKNYMVVWK